ncbi:MAG TPA: septal ring lytic transglycosylase RlpA family protein [Nitrospirota bacterium]|nr:septal ring lytic transglycosylase RlpA family protein [Nitrospirota bacterium]
MRIRFWRQMIQIPGGAALIAAALYLASCAAREVPPAPPVHTAPSPEPAAAREVPPAPPVHTAPSPEPAAVQEYREVYRERGTASWYGKEFHGRKTASGEKFDMYGISAAHRTLPLGTTLRVTNLDNYKSIKVRVNDRGPFASNRVLELSYGAARELGFVAQGTARVKIESLEPVQDLGQYTVQAAVFAEAENARMLKYRLSKRFEVTSIVLFESNVGRFFLVRVGAYASEEKAELIAGKLMMEGLEPIVMRKD